MGSSQKFFVVIALLLLGFSFLAVKNAQADLSTDITPPVITFTSHCNAIPPPPDATINTSSLAPIPFTNGMTLMDCGGASQDITLTYADNGPGDVGLEQVFYQVGAGVAPVFGPIINPTITVTPLYALPTPIHVLNTTSQYTIRAWAQDHVGAWQGTAPDYINVIVKFKYSITGNVYVDYDWNGAQSGSDTGFTGGATITLIDSLGATQSTTSDLTTGIFSFQNINPGTYTVQLENTAVLANYLATGSPCNGPQTCSPPVSTTVAASSTGNLSVSFGVTPQYTISGIVWIDNPNKNGLYQPPGETGYSGLTSVTAVPTLAGANGGTFSCTNGNPPPCSDGKYTITGLLAGGYDLNFQPPAGYRLTYPCNSGGCIIPRVNVGPPAGGVSASYTGLQFTNVLIPEGAQITSAQVQIAVPSEANSSVSFDMYAEAADNSSPFSSSQPSQRTLTTSKINHTSNADWLPGSWYTLGDLGGASGPIQEVINRPGWAPGNALSLIFKGTGAQFERKFIASYDGNPSPNLAAQVLVTYTLAGIAQPPVTLQITDGNNDVNQDTAFQANNTTLWVGNGDSSLLTCDFGSITPSAPGQPACDASGNITGMNFGMTDELIWFQCNGADCRNDTGFSDPIPATTPTPVYASNPFPVAVASPGNSGNNMPGVIFIGGNNCGAFGPGGCGGASVQRWVAGASSFPETSSVTHRTSYTYLLNKANQEPAGSIKLLSDPTYCPAGLGSCTLTNLTNGIYQAIGDLTIVDAGSGTYTFPSGKNVVILVSGNLTIQTKIIVPVGSTATFSVAGNSGAIPGIHVGRNVGEDGPPHSSTATDIEGFYSSDKNFYADGLQAETGLFPCNLGTPDKRLNIGGSVVVNAGSTGGKFLPYPIRDLCNDDHFYPSVAIYFRPDFAANIPEFLKYQNAVWQEVAP